MITRESTLADICFAVSAALEDAGISGVLTGGSAAALYAPLAYPSHDADFILADDDRLDDVAVALVRIGFRRYGRSRIFAHPESEFTVDFPKGPLAVAREYIHETAIIERGSSRIRILTRFDCVRDRLAHFYCWDDFTALGAAVAVASDEASDVDFIDIRAWTERENPALLEKFGEFERRAAAALKALSKE